MRHQPVARKLAKNPTSIGHANALVAKIRKSKRMTIEAEFYGGEKRQIEFNVAGFDATKLAKVTGQDLSKRKY